MHLRNSFLSNFIVGRKEKERKTKQVTIKLETNSGGQIEFVHICGNSEGEQVDQ